VELAAIFQKLGIALLLGLLVGLQRQSANSRTAGIRTFALVSLLGGLSGLLVLKLGATWLLGAGLVAITLLLIVSNLEKLRSPEPDPGLTTEAAVLLMYFVSAYVFVGETPVAIATAGVTALLLHLKEPLHRFVSKIGGRDLKAIMQFVLLALVILPVLPDVDVGPYNSLNPRELWFMVVLIVGISLVGYVAFRILGPRKGALLAGILGGIISSTATTASYARRSATVTELVPSAALVICIASTIAFLRVLVEVWVVSPGIMPHIIWPLGAMLVLMGLVSLALYLRKKAPSALVINQDNPSELRMALAFGALYALISLAVVWGRNRFGTQGLYSVAFLSGLADVDAITLSTASLMKRDQIGPDLGWRVILIASLSNLAFKAMMCLILGGKRLFRSVAAPFGIAIAGGLLLVYVWPRG
jgi:uncharacterized membrane protein (DUF4010 family)